MFDAKNVTLSVPQRHPCLKCYNSVVFYNLLFEMFDLCFVDDKAILNSAKYWWNWSALTAKFWITIV